MKRKTSLLLCAALPLPLLGLTCPPDLPTLPDNGVTLVAEIPTNLPSGILAIDAANGRALIGDGERIRTVDLERRAEVSPGAGQGILYGIDPNDDLLVGVSPTDGRVKSFRPTNPDGAIQFVQGIACNEDTGTIYLADNAPAGRRTRILEYNPADESVRTVLPEPILETIDPRFALEFVTGLARQPGTGHLFAVTIDDFLWRLEPQTGVAARIGLMNQQPGAAPDIQGLTFTSDGTLYGVNAMGGPLAQGFLARIDPVTADRVIVGLFPLGYLFYCLAATPDGMLWSVRASSNVLVQIDPADAAILREFTNLTIPVSFGPDHLFEQPQALTYCPDFFAAGRMPPGQSLRGVTAGANGKSFASTLGKVFAFDGGLGFDGAPAHVGGLNAFEELLVDPQQNAVFSRDGNGGTVFVFGGSPLELVQQFQYKDPVRTFSRGKSNSAAWDPVTRRLFFVDHLTVFIVNMDDASTEMLEFADPIEGVLMDEARRRLYVGTQGGPSGRSELVSLSPSDFSVLGRMPLGTQIHKMALDAQRNRLAVNVRVNTSFTTQIVLVNLDDMSEITRFDLPPDADGDFESTIDAVLAIDAERNQLVVTRPGQRPRVELYQLPQ
ncbi:MAG: hypothetical protein HUU22_08675 [Phycisphaerae bacterium]|nr:hypothetical protein [Phycisphaerae bacterium]NUQ46094.1 hypothetical protein [Phycisphaerae bacterium]